MFISIEHHDYMVARHSRVYPTAPFLVVAMDTDILSMKAITSLKPGMFLYQSLLMSGCLIDDLCGDPVR